MRLLEYQTKASYRSIKFSEMVFDPLSLIEDYKQA